VVPEQSKHELLKTKLEVRLRKAAPGAWPTLQASGAPQPAASFADTAVAHPPSYPSSRRAAGRALACPALARALPVQQPCLLGTADVVGARPCACAPAVLVPLRARCRPFLGKCWAGACTTMHQFCLRARAQSPMPCVSWTPDLGGGAVWAVDAGERGWARQEKCPCQAQISAEAEAG
jgi:hypothetical protein